MTEKEKIRAEVERLRKSYQIMYQELDCESPKLMSVCAKRNLCQDILMFIDSLQEELVSEGLEEAAKNHAVERFRTTRDAFLAEKCKWSFIAGAQWRLDSLWHDISEKQPKELETVIYKGKKWCSLSDILSMTKDKKI